MAAYLLRRLWQMVPTILGVVLLVFFLFKYFGGDPAEILGGLNATPEQIAAIRQQLGLDEPVWYQLWIYLKSVVTFDWGKSWATNEAVSNLFATEHNGKPALFHHLLCARCNLIDDLCGITLHANGCVGVHSQSTRFAFALPLLELPRGF